VVCERDIGKGKIREVQQRYFNTCHGWFTNPRRGQLFCKQQVKGKSVDVERSPLISTCSEDRRLFFSRFLRSLPHKTRAPAFPTAHEPPSLLLISQLLFRRLVWFSRDRMSVAFNVYNGVPSFPPTPLTRDVTR